MKKSPDNVSNELREIEKEVDSYYLKNSLMKLDFGEAAWCFLSYVEKLFFEKMLKSKNNPQNIALIGDFILTSMKWPLRWLKSTCTSGKFNRQEYKCQSLLDAEELFKLAKNYEWFELAFTYASIGKCRLEKRGNQIIPTDELRKIARYSAYDRLVQAKNDFSLSPNLNQNKLKESIKRHIKLEDGIIKFNLSDESITLGIQYCKSELKNKFKLPQKWSFSTYTLKNYFDVILVIYTLSSIYLMVKVIATSNNFETLECNDVKVIDKKKLLDFLVKYSKVKQTIVKHIMNDITYGRRGINNPDPAIQPLILLDENCYAIAPCLFLTSSFERNLLVLFNKIKKRERDIYDTLKGHKEKLLRDDIKTELKEIDLIFFNGKINNKKELPDIDLAMISQREKICIIAEIKYFVAPAEVREMADKTEEINKGISQINTLQNEFSINKTDFFNKLGIDDKFTIVWLIISENSIGINHNECDNSYIINAHHLVRKIKLSKSLVGIPDWVFSKAYLPIENEDYTIEDKSYSIGMWKMQWFGVKPISENIFI